ncbi:MAG: UvrD-helicase domain-containing protein [Ignavibacteria bacterium]
MKETREQVLGKAFDRHLSVSAGAGSGKTRVLVQRFIHILEHHPGIDLSSIVAITFTRKAAAEMMKRVMDAVEVRLQDAIDNERILDVQMWARIRQHISSARISTIDSFCSQIVREYPLEANVPHTLTPLPKSKAVMMRKECIEEALIHFLNEEHPQSELIRRMFHAHHHSTITKALEYLMMKGKLALTTLEEILKNEDDIIIQNAWKSIRDEIGDSLSTIFQAIDQLPGYRNADFIKQELVNKWEELRVLKDDFTLGQFDEKTLHFLQLFVSINKELISKYITQKGETAAQFKKYSDQSIDEWINEYFPIISSLRKQVEGLCIIGTVGLKHGDSVVSAEKEALQFARLILEIAMHATSSFESQKRNEGTLEFSDIQTLAMELLEHPEAGPKIRSSIQFLMIDEFQDTNAMQYELASRIVRSLKEEDEDHKVNLYIVGDPKQSIYGFRSADVRVFGMATKDIQKANVNNGKMNTSEELTEDEQKGMLSLRVSFRLLPGIIAFVNDLFSRLMGNESIDYEVAYEPMIAGRNVSQELLESGEIGSITFLIHEESKEEEQDMVDEAGLIASAIKDIVQNKSRLIWDSQKDEDGKEIPYLREGMYKDCTVLYERRTMVNILMAALRAEGIPYFTSGNKGFYTSPAIVDIRNYLTFLSNPNDDLALASILISPFFSVGDDALFAMRMKYSDGGLWQNMIEYVHEHDAIDDVKKAYEILLGFRDKAQTMSLPILIHSMLEASHWRNIVKRMDDGEQWIANAEKLIGIAREFEQRGFRHIHAFVDELELSAEYDDEPEAPIINSENAVNLMTIHASKGLEFPIVFLYDTNAKERSTQPALYESDQFGIGLPLIKEYRVAGSHETEQSLLSMAIGMERRSRLISEKKRLLYVALTRAKDHVFISTSHKQGKSFAERSMIHMISQYSSAYATLPSIEQGSYTFQTKLIIQGDEQEKEISIPIHIQKTLNESQSMQEVEKKSYQGDLQLFGKTKQEYKDEWYSISQFMMLESDEQEFRKKYVFGFPNATIEHHAGFVNDENHEDITSAQFGIMMHQALEHIQKWVNVADVNEVMIDSIIDDIIQNHMSHSLEKDEVKQRMRRLCHAIGTSNLMQRHHTSLINIKTEYSLTIPIEDDFFCVIYDLLIENENGEWEIWDWKTNGCSTQEQMDILAERYTLQMRYYAYVLSLLKPGQFTYTTRLLFTNMIAKSADESEWTKTIKVDMVDMPRIYEEIRRHILQAKQSVLL